MKRSHTAQKISCPKCNNTITRVFSVEKRGGTAFKVRYRKCTECSHTFRTEQIIEPEVGQELAVPPVGPSYPRHTKLTADEVLDIKRLLANDVFSVSDLALQYEVHYSTIRWIKTGKSWAHLKLA